MKLCHVGCGAHLRHAALCLPGTVIPRVLSSWEQGVWNRCFSHLDLALGMDNVCECNSLFSLWQCNYGEYLGSMFQKCCYFHMCVSAYLSNRSVVMVHCSWVGDESIGLFWFCEKVRAHVGVPCVVLFVSLYITVYVCLSCCVYKYIFCTECTKGLGLAKSTIRPALSFSLTNTSHFWLLPNPYRTSLHVCLRGRFVAWATALHV